MPALCLIENDGALFRGPGRGNPQDVYLKGGWKPYKGAGRPRDVSWGNVIDEAEAKELMAEIDGGDAGGEDKEPAESNF